MSLQLEALRDRYTSWDITPITWHYPLVPGQAYTYQQRLQDPHNDDDSLYLGMVTSDNEFKLLNNRSGSGNQISTSSIWSDIGIDLFSEEGHLQRRSPQYRPCETVLSEAWACSSG